MHYSYMSRKGSVRDIGILMVSFFTFVLAGVFSLVLYSDFNTALQDTLNETNMLDANTTTILDNGVDAVETTVKLIPFFVFGLGFAAIISAFFIPTHPIFFPISVLLLLVFTVIQAMMANVMWEVINQTEIIILMNNFPVVVAFIQYSPWFIAILGFILIAVMYSKRGQGFG